MLDKINEVSILAAKEAGKILKEGFGTSFNISSKEGRNNLVTEYDLLSEKMIINILKNEFPDSMFLAEESGSSGKEEMNQIKWIIDPLDGTVNFAHALPIFSISIAAEINGDIVSGVIYNPILDELFVAIKGRGAFMNGNKINVSRVDDYQSSFLVTGFPYNADENPCQCIDLFVTMVQQGIPIRRLGSAALDLAYVACGRFDGFWEIELKPWDVAAGTLIVEEAGGLITNYNLEKFSIYDTSLLATNSLIHNDISEILNNCIHFKR